MQLLSLLPILILHLNFLVSIDLVYTDNILYILEVRGEKEATDL